MKILIVTNGPLDLTGPWAETGLQADRIVAADGGASHARNLGLVPNVVVGDVDSLDEGTRAWLTEHKVPVLRFPRAKDETDLELALLHAVECGAQEIIILGAIGGRPDQTIANLHLLAHPALAGRRVVALGADYELFLLRGGEQARIEGKPGEIVSLLPLSAQARGIHTSGLRWALKGETLHFGPARGVSNELTAPEGHVRLEKGLLLVVHLFGQG